MSIDMVKSKLIVLLKYCSKRVFGLRSLFSRFAASESSGGDWSAPDLPHSLDLGAPHPKSCSPNSRLGVVDQA